ncbi:MAG: beta-ribofuranosylaminobenzene 5'-phosphate synthase family protein [Candidatus Thermoplasmatota archaeon]
MIVQTPSRLHFGIIDLSRSFRREYGALGLCLKNGYEIELNVKGPEGVDVKGDEREKKIVKNVYARLKDEFDLSSGFDVVIKERVPSHVGLGSTTQITLGAGYGMLKSVGEDIDTPDLAEILDRARYSAIGTYGFKLGGFILEGGKTETDEVPPLLFRGQVPEDWRFLIICPEESRGYDEEEEKPIMDELQVEKKYAEKICHNVLIGILPALKEKNIEAFGSHLTEIQRLVGNSFSDYQEGTYHPAVADTVEKLIEETYGAGQSSWGPTAYGLVQKDDVNKILEKVLPNDRSEHRVWIGRPNNQGVKIKR